MIAKIKRQDAFDKYTKFPWHKPIQDEFYFPKAYRSHILTLKSKTIKGHIKSLSSELTQLICDLQFASLIFLGDTETPWLYQDNDYASVKEALQYLRGNKIGQRFNGALQVDIANLKDFIKHLAWLTRCNASLPIFHFSDKGQNILGSICKYGNVHLNTLNKRTDNEFEQLIVQSEFLRLNGTKCFDQFSKTGAIKYRQIVV